MLIALPWHFPLVLKCSIYGCAQESKERKAEKPHTRNGVQSPYSNPSLPGTMGFPKQSYP